MGVQQIDVTELAGLLGRGEPVYLVDVRQPWEHEIARLPGGVLVPLDQLAARIDEVAPPEGAMLVAYCHHGVRSLHAAGLLARAGHAEVYSLAGGIDAWSTTIDASVPRY